MFLKYGKVAEFFDDAKVFPIMCGGAKLSGAEALMRRRENFSWKNGAVAHRFKKWRTSRWREFKKVARAQHWALPNGQQLHLDILSLKKHFFPKHIV